MEKTGIKIKTMIKSAGYDVKYIQKYLHLSCPQPIYRWFKGKALPSVDHLCALSLLLNVHMEELLVLQQQISVYELITVVFDGFPKRLLCYYDKLNKIA